MKIRTEDIIDIVDKVDGIFHDYGFVVNHDILSIYVIKTIRESYPSGDTQIGELDTKLMKKLYI